MSEEETKTTVAVVENQANREVTTITETPPPVKPGYKTTEFYITLGVTVLGMLWGAGIFGEGTSLDRALGLAAMALAPFGYTLSRGAAKKSVKL